MNARRFLSLPASLLVAVAALAPVAAPAAERDTPGDLVITLEPGASIDTIDGRYGTQSMQRIPGTTTYRVRAPRKKKILKKLRKDSSVLKASPDGVVRRQQTVGFPHDTPDVVDESQDPERVYRAQTSETGLLETLQVDSASALTESGDEVTIAVLDTGVDLSHTALAGRLWTNPSEVPGNGVDDDGDGYVDDAAGWNFVDNTPDASESAGSGSIAGHGTFIAGLIALTSSKARVMPLKVLDGDGVGSAFAAAAAVNFAVQHGARVVSMSFGADGRVAPRVLREAVESARELNVVLVAAVGNNASGFIPYPASDVDNVISVGATDAGQNRAPFSNYAPDAVDVWAPGVELVSAMPGTYEDGAPRYATWSGTSFSTGLVAAGCSVLLSTAQVSDPNEIRDRIKDNGPDITDGTGKQVNFFEAVGSVLRDAGALDVWSGSYLSPLSEGAGNGYVVLRTIGEAQRLTAYAQGMGAFESYDFYVSPISNPDGFVKVNGDGPIAADTYGNFKFVAAGGARASDGTPLLPIPLDEIKIAIFVKTGDGSPAIGADVDPASETVALWAGVGLKAVNPSPDPRTDPFARAVLSYDPRVDGAYQGFAVASCQVRSNTEYALAVNGREVIRAQSSDDGGGVGSVGFYFSNDPNEIANNHAIPLSEETTPQIYPVTSIREVVISEVGTDGGLAPVVAGRFAGPAAKWLERRFR